MSTIKISTQYTTTPGARYKSDGPYSGQEFFEKFLIPAFQNAMDKNEILTVDLDGTQGYASSFLSEAFGLLSSNFGVQKVLDLLNIISIEEPDWKEAILKDYIPNGGKRKKEMAD